jgi:hypothetical protein
MVAHYSKERSKYGTLTGSIIIWPVEMPVNNPNTSDNVKSLPAGYLRCDGSKYNANDYPDLAAICGTGTNCKFTRLDENDDPIQTLGDDEFVVPDLGSKYPRPVSTGDAGTFNNILVENQNGVFIKRSGIGIEATSNVGDIAEVTYSGDFIVPSQVIPLSGKPAWTWGDNKYTDVESVDAAAIHPHMHFSQTNRVRIKGKSAETGGVISLEPLFYNMDDSAVNLSNLNGTAFVGFGSGTGEIGGFASPGFGNGYVAFGGSSFGSLQNTRECEITITNTGYTLLTVTAITGNDTNGGERPNNVGEGLFIIWPDGTTSSSPIIPSRKESGLSQGSYDAQYDSWLTQSLAIPEQYRQGTYTFKFRQTNIDPGDITPEQPYGLEITEEGYAAGAGPNNIDMMGILRVGLDGGFIEDPNLPSGVNGTANEINYFKSASTIDVEAWLDATKASGPNNDEPGSGQPACWAIASGTLSGTQKSSQQLLSPLPVVINQVTHRWGWCDTGCSLANLRCYCLLTNDVNYDLEKDWFGITGTRFNNSLDSLGLCTPLSDGVNWDQDGVAPATYGIGKTGVTTDWKGLYLNDVVPLNANTDNPVVYPQARNIGSEVEEYTTDEDGTIHNHKIIVEREDHNFSIVTEAFLLDPENLNTTLQLTPSTAASIDLATCPFIVLEYLIKI